jgi:hypothetical protein
MPPSPQPPATTSDARPSPTVSVVIPALNEEANLPHVLEGLPPVDEVVIVDGGSADDTVAVAREVRPDAVVVRQTRIGKGNALVCGFAASRGDIVITLNADGSTDPGEIPRYVDALLAGAEVAHGSRYREGGGDLGGHRLDRLGNALLSRFVNALFGTRFTDLGYGYNAYWRALLPALDLPGVEVPRLKRGELLWGDGPEIEPMLNIRVAAQGMRVVEVASIGYPPIHGVRERKVLRRALRALRAAYAEYRRRWQIGRGPAAADTAGARRDGGSNTGSWERGLAGRGREATAGRGTGGHLHAVPSDTGSHLRPIPRPRDLSDTGSHLRPISVPRDLSDTGSHLRPVHRDLSDTGSHLRPVHRDLSDTGSHLRPVHRDLSDTGSHARPTLGDPADTGSYPRPVSGGGTDTGGHARPDADDLTDTGSRRRPMWRDVTGTGSHAWPTIGGRRPNADTGGRGRQDWRETTDTGSGPRPDWRRLAETGGGTGERDLTRPPAGDGGDDQRQDLGPAARRYPAESPSWTQESGRHASISGETSDVIRRLPKLRRPQDDPGTDTGAHYRIDPDSDDDPGGPDEGGPGGAAPARDDPDVPGAGPVGPARDVGDRRRRLDPSDRTDDGRPDLSVISGDGWDRPGDRRPTHLRALPGERYGRR